VRGGSRVPASDLHAINACWSLFLPSTYLVVAEAASFDKKEPCRSDTSVSLTALAERDKKQTMIDLRGIPANWCNNQLFPFIMLSRLWAQRYYNYAGILEQSMEARNHNPGHSKDDILN
jgi:hypothetical protein